MDQFTDKAITCFPPLEKPSVDSKFNTSACYNGADELALMVTAVYYYSNFISKKYETYHCDAYNLGTVVLL